LQNKYTSNGSSSSADLPLQRENTLHSKNIAPQQANTRSASNFSGSETHDAFTLSDKIKYLKLKSLLNDSQEIEPKIFPQFVDLPYEFRDIFAHSVKELT